MKIDKLLHPIIIGISIIVSSIILTIGISKALVLAGKEARSHVNVPSTIRLDQHHTDKFRIRVIE